VGDLALVLALGLATSPYNQCHRGRRVITIAGMDHPAARPGTPDQALALLAAVRTTAASYGGVIILGLGPTYCTSLTTTPAPIQAGQRSIDPTM
jgi:hypothetical protein